jgi:DNA-binding transcriptional LysR family regulator
MARSTPASPAMVTATRKRHRPLSRTPAAIVQGTGLVAALANRLLETLTIGPSLIVIPATAEIGRVAFLMAWHPGLESDPAHRWLRETIQSAAFSDLASDPRSTSL